MMVIRRLLAFLATFTLVSCAVLPVAELTTYSEAYASAKTAGDLILDEVAAVFPQSDDPKAGPRCDVNPATGFRPCFSVAQALGDGRGGPAEPVDIRVRRLALEVIAAYNQMLVDVAEGRSAKVVNSRIDALSEFAAALTGLAPGVTSTVAAIPFDAVKSIVTRLENARATNAAARSVVEAAPDVRRLLRFMINDTPALYRLYVVQYEGQLGQALIDLKRAQLRGNTAEADRLQQVVNNLRDPSGSANKARAFEQALTTYVKVLDQTDKAIVELVEAITLSDLSPVERATGFVKRATETRLLIEELEADIRNLRSAGR